MPKRKSHVTLRDLRGDPIRYHPAKIALDTLRKPLLSLLSPPSVAEASETLLRLGFDPAKVQGLRTDAERVLRELALGTLPRS